MRERRCDPRQDGDIRADEFVRALVVAVRTVAVYPASHPRAIATAEAALEQARERNGVTVTAHDGEVRCDGQPVAPDDQAVWLASHLRQASLRGLRVLPCCRHDELIAFARSLLAAQRPGAAANTEAAPDRDEEAAGLELLALRFTGDFDGTGDGDPVDDVDPGTGEVIATGGVPVGFGFRGDGEAALGDLLGGLQPGGELPEADLPYEVLARQMLKAGRVAARYFGIDDDTAEREPHGKPTGRPEDAAIGPDIDQLVAEVEALPPPAKPTIEVGELTSSVAPALARQLLGVYLYLFFSDCTESARREVEGPLRRTIATLGADACDQLDVYLASGTGGPISARDRLALLHLIDQADRPQLIAQRGYLDAELIAAGFPHTLSLAARAFGDDHASFATVHRAFERIVGERGASAINDLARESTALTPSLVRGLLAGGGEVTERMIEAVLWIGRLDLFDAVIAHCASLDLPAAERSALVVLQPKDPGIVAYLQLLAREAATGSATLRERTAELLRRQVHTMQRAGDPARTIRAIEDLVLVPDARTAAVLLKLRGPRLATLLPGRRGAIRRAAHRALATVRKLCNE